MRKTKNYSEEKSFKTERAARRELKEAAKDGFISNDT